MSLVEEHIADSMDDAMRRFIQSEEYILSRSSINKSIADFRGKLPEGLQREFIQLMDAVNNHDAKFASTAYTYGVINGIASREQVLRP